MRIVSLLPSLTETVHFLGKSADLVGVSHACDYPPQVALLPKLTKSRIPDNASSLEIDRIVSQLTHSIFDLDLNALSDLKPDLILTQRQCRVCAIDEASVLKAAASMNPAPRVVSVNPQSLTDVQEMVLHVGEALGEGARERAGAWLDDFFRIADTIRERLCRQPLAPHRAGLSFPRSVAHLEWLDPFYTTGHWNPELIQIAGGVDLLGFPGKPSRRVTFEELVSMNPSLILVAPCGYDLVKTRSDWEDTLKKQPGLRQLSAVREGQVWMADGNAYFSRPGPRLTKALRMLAAAIHPSLFADLQPVSDAHSPNFLHWSPEPDNVP